VSIDSGARRTMTRLLYPKLAQRLSAADLHRIFGPTHEERQWAPTVARSPSSQVALLVQLKIFQNVGRLRVNQTVGGDFSLPVASGRLKNLVYRLEWPCD
jgi:Domain of unknown function (DUF4158)